MQYVGRLVSSVYNSVPSINPATLSGAIDIIVVEKKVDVEEDVPDDTPGALPGAMKKRVRSTTELSR
jgi:phosphatidate phosphatase LPIN